MEYPRPLVNLKESVTPESSIRSVSAENNKVTHPPWAFAPALEFLQARMTLFSPFCSSDTPCSSVPLISSQDFGYTQKAIIGQKYRVLARFQGLFLLFYVLYLI